MYRLAQFEDTVVSFRHIGRTQLALSTVEWKIMMVSWTSVDRSLECATLDFEYVGYLVVRLFRGWSRCRFSGQPGGV